MTTEREATYWMLVAMAVVVLACTAVGCRQAPLAGPIIDPTLSPSMMAWDEAAPIGEDAANLLAASR